MRLDPATQAAFDADGVEILGAVDVDPKCGLVLRWKGFSQPPFEPANGRGITGQLRHDSPYEQGWCKAPITVSSRSAPA